MGNTDCISVASPGQGLILGTPYDTGWAMYHLTVRTGLFLRIRG